MKNQTPVQAIRAKCIDCSGGQLAEVRFCPLNDCPLHPFRMRRNPNCKGRKVSEDQPDHQPQETGDRWGVSVPGSKPGPRRLVHVGDGRGDWPEMVARATGRNTWANVGELGNTRLGPPGCRYLGKSLGPIGPWEQAP